MKRLAQCHHCERMFDVSSYEAGTRIHCYCGEPIEVRAAKAHDAEVVRCSGCGGAREGAQATCGYCQAPFTLHDRDLNTVCPKCTCRVSDKAEYCHSCGQALAAITLKAEQSKMPCPACGTAKKLSRRKLGAQQVAFAECTSCAGLWLDWQSFQLLCQRSLAQPVEQVVPIQAAQPKTQAVGGGGMYRRCPDCDSVMNRVHYAYRTGVIIDACMTGKHGVWFDLDELAKVLRWLHRGGRADDRVTTDLSILRRDGLSSPAPVPDAPQATQSTESPPASVPAPAAVSDDVYVIDDEVDLDQVLQSLFQE